MSRNVEPQPLQLRPPSERRNQPSIAIVVTSSCDVTTLRSCLASLGEQCARVGAKLIVAHAGALPDLGLLGAENIPLTLVTAPSGTSAADLRRVCAWRSDHNIIAFADDCSQERIAWAVHLCSAWRSWSERRGRISPPAPSFLEPDAATRARPYLSVVVPAHNAAATLSRSLEAIVASDLPRELWELVVVDDSSSDRTPVLAAQYADRLIQLPDGPHGPGYARNRGFEMTLGECVAFVNADVMVHPDTLRRFYEVLTNEPDVGGVFGSYDTRPMASDFVSQHRTLMQHYYHRQNPGESSTFWSGCGAVRCRAFQRAGCFNEWHFRRRQLEDLELGQRIRLLGHRVLLRPEIQVTNLKHWTVGGIVATEIFDRGVPWMRLVNRAVLRARADHNSLRATKRLNIAATSLGVVLALVGFLSGSEAILAGAAACFTIVALDDMPQLSFFRRERGVTFALKSACLDLLYYLVSGIAVVLGWIAQHTVGEPRPAPVTEAFAELNVKTWPPVPSQRLPSAVALPVAEALADAAPSHLMPVSESSKLSFADAPNLIDIPPSAPLQ